MILSCRSERDGMGSEELVALVIGGGVKSVAAGLRLRVAIARQLSVFTL